MFKNDLNSNKSKKAPTSGGSSAGPGHSLGGTAVANDKPLSPNELRERRLAALGGSAAASGGGSSTTTSPVKQQTPPPASSTIKPQQTVTTMECEPPVVGGGGDHDDEMMDPDLQAALQMSLQPQEEDTQQLKQPTASTPSPAKTPHHHPSSTSHQSDTAATAMPTKAISSSALGDYACTVETYTDISSFHSIMWDSVMTTDNDKQRWVGQGISTRDHPHPQEQDNNTMNLETPPPSTTTTSGPRRSLLDIIGSNHTPWGLIQTHGGPCGVLAAVQAEMLRLLLFGQQQHQLHNDITSPSLEYPTILPDDDNDSHSTESSISEDHITQSLAMSLGIILARCAIMPSAADGDSTITNTVKDETNASVQIVLPTNPSKELSWNDLEPWSSSSSSSSSSGVHNTQLQLYTISNNSTSKSNSHTTGSTTKRQRKNSPSNTNDNNNNNTSNDNPWQHVPEPREERIIRLSKTITNFLLHPRKIQQQQKDQEDGKEEEQNNIFIPLDSFRRPGGVLLLVMSLVASRGCDTLQHDFDDTHGTKLTSQFGHSSQELINVLLTGQAVSNVFDNTLKPSGDLTCRGIQSRPVVGYLSQLESLRYCEVGGYYKFPRFPVWVVGSTSHFTVMFGGPSCLKESESDVLLEKCRRAFKKAEGEGGGTGENGFIDTKSLGNVLTSLELNVGGDSAVQTLAATLEVGGAGIILWDDFWQATSRLMTGASLESVLQGNHHHDASGAAAAAAHDPSSTSSSPPPLLITQYGEGQQTNNPMDNTKPSSTTTSSSAAPKSMAESDEELARRLAAEWGSPVADTTPTMHTSTATAAARPASPMDVDPTGMSDEDFARKLQAQWDAESAGGTTTPSTTSYNNNNNNNNNYGGVVDLVNSHRDNDNNTTAATTNPQEIGHSSLSTPDPPGLLVRSPSGGGGGGGGGGDTAATSTNNQKLQFESFGNSFPLFHYNGLRGGTLTPFRVTRLSAEEAVGASIALSVHSGTGGGGHSGAGSGGGDLEDVVRTKWPSSMIDWLGRKPPYID